jgi:N utilization substance protein B
MPGSGQAAELRLVSKKRAGTSRRRAREVALQVLYAIDLASTRARPEPDDEPPVLGRRRDSKMPDPTPIPTPSEVFDGVADHFEMPEGARRFARQLVDDVRQNAEQIDATISSHARNWRISRMAAVDRNILRLGTFELSFTQTPSAVILNEAVDLARRFCTDPSPAFVNGILDAIARGVRESVE